MNVLTIALAGYPLYKQCDDRWAADLMGIDDPAHGHRATVCEEGCAMSCVAMVLVGSGFALPGSESPPTPGSLNEYLISHHEYTCAAGDCDNLVLDAPDRLTGGRMRLVGEWPMADLAASHIKDALAVAEMAYLAHVHNPVVSGSGHRIELSMFCPAYSRGSRLSLFPGTERPRQPLCASD